jgi:GxxExxY protein
LNFAELTESIYSLAFIRLPYSVVMPIHRPSIRDLSPSEFDEIDRVVMGCAFSSQNELGRLCDEKIYETDLTLRLRALGRNVERQVPITASHGSFSKTYRLDLICDSSVYDAKTVSAFVGGHESQVLNYAMLLNIRHVKLLNFRTPSVEGKLCFNAVTERLRYQYQIDYSEFQELSSSCRELISLISDLLEDWGAFLAVRLYEAALIHFLGGESSCVRRAELHRNGHLLGAHEVIMYWPWHFVVLSAVTREEASYRQHLRRLLKLTGLAGIQWFNFNHHRIHLVTLT